MKKQIYIKGIVGLLLVIGVFILMTKYVGGYLVNYLDYPSMGCIVLVTVVSLYAGNQWKNFIQAIKTSFKQPEEKIEKAEIKKMEYSIDYAIKAVIIGGIFISFIAIVGLFHNLADASTIGPHFAVAILSIVWSFFLSLIFLQIKGRIHSLLK